MKAKLIVVAGMMLWPGAAALAHRLDEYLQATILSVEKDHVDASMRLVPGVSVFSIVLASIDTNGDGVISAVEQRTYVESVLRELSVTVDGKGRKPALISWKFPATEEMKEGLGVIEIDFKVDLPPGGPERSITLENHHQNEISAYLVNCLVPHDRSIRVLRQRRNETQSFYQLDYAQSGGDVRASPSILPSSD